MAPRHQISPALAPENGSLTPIPASSSRQAIFVLEAETQPIPEPQKPLSGRSLPKPGDGEPVKESLRYVAIQPAGRKTWTAYRCNNNNLLSSVRHGHIPPGTRATAAELERRCFLACIRKNWANGLWVELAEMLDEKSLQDIMARELWAGLAVLSERMNLEKARIVLGTAMRGRSSLMLGTEDVQGALRVVDFEREGTDMR